MVTGVDIGTNVEVGGTVNGVDIAGAGCVAGCGGGTTLTKALRFSGVYSAAAAAVTCAVAAAVVAGGGVVGPGEAGAPPPTAGAGTVVGTASSGDVISGTLSCIVGRGGGGNGVVPAGAGGIAAPSGMSTCGIAAPRNVKSAAAFSLDTGAAGCFVVALLGDVVGERGEGMMFNAEPAGADGGDNDAGGCAGTSGVPSLLSLLKFPDIFTTFVLLPSFTRYLMFAADSDVLSSSTCLRMSSKMD